MKYSEKLKDPRWQKKRLEIMQRDNFKCEICGDTESTLVVHHWMYTKNTDPWDYPNEILSTLCEYCHEEEHETELTEYDKNGILNEFKINHIPNSDRWKLVIDASILYNLMGRGTHCLGDLIELLRRYKNPKKFISKLLGEINE